MAAASNVYTWWQWRPRMTMVTMMMMMMMMMMIMMMMMMKKSFLDLYIEQEFVLYWICHMTTFKENDGYHLKGNSSLIIEHNPVHTCNIPHYSTNCHLHSISIMSLSFCSSVSVFRAAIFHLSFVMSPNSITTRDSLRESEKIMTHLSQVFNKLLTILKRHLKWNCARWNWYEEITTDTLKLILSNYTINAWNNL